LEEIVVQTSKERSGNSEETEHEVDTTAVAAAAGQAATAEKLRDDTDDILDEIDNVLESEAEDFVRNYIQKGGQ
jgi:ubiquitin-like protein Pup